MNKYRLEALSDGVFSILMTLLIIELRVPLIVSDFDKIELLHALIQIAPKFLAFFLSFIVITLMWLSHHIFLAKFTKSINRRVVLLNAFLLASVSLVPYSASLIGTYPNNQTATIWYGLNIILVGIMSNIQWYYITGNPDLRKDDIDLKELLQARIRSSLSPTFAFIAIIFSFVNPWISYGLFAFPVIFNLVPGSLDLVEKYFGIDLAHIAKERMQ